MELYEGSEVISLFDASVAKMNSLLKYEYCEIGACVNISLNVLKDPCCMDDHMKLVLFLRLHHRDRRNTFCYFATLKVFIRLYY